MIVEIEFSAIRHYLPIEFLYPAQVYNEIYKENYTVKHWYQTLCGTYVAVSSKINEDPQTMIDYILSFMPQITIYLTYNDEYNAYIYLLTTEDFNTWKNNANVEDKRIHRLKAVIENNYNLTQFIEFDKIQEIISRDLLCRTEQYYEFLHKKIYNRPWYSTTCGEYYTTRLFVNEYSQTVLDYIKTNLPPESMIRISRETLDGLFIIILERSQYEYYLASKKTVTKQLDCPSTQSQVDRPPTQSQPDSSSDRPYKRQKTLGEYLQEKEYKELLTQVQSPIVGSGFLNSTQASTPNALHEFDLEEPIQWEDHYVIKIAFEKTIKYLPPNFCKLLENGKNKKNTWHGTTDNKFFATFAKREVETKNQENHITIMTPAGTTIYACPIEGEQVSCIYLLKADVFMESNLFKNLMNESVHYYPMVQAWEKSLTPSNISFSAGNLSINYLQFERFNCHNLYLINNLSKFSLTDTYKEKKNWFEVTINNVVYYATIIASMHRQRELENLLTSWKLGYKSRIELRIALTSSPNLELLLLQQAYFNAYKIVCSHKIDKVFALPQTSDLLDPDLLRNKTNFDAELSHFLRSNHAFFVTPNTSQQTSTTTTTTSTELSELFPPKNASNS